MITKTGSVLVCLVTAKKSDTIVECSATIEIFKMKKRFKFLIFALLFGLLTATNSSGQIVTPSLDPGLPAELSSAVAWRFGSAFGVNSVYNKEKSETTENDYYYNRTGVLFAYQPGTVIGEIYGESVTRQSLWDSSTDTFVDSTGTRGKLSLAIRGENRVSVGIGYNSSDQTVTGSEPLRTTYFEGSFSMRLFGGFYLAGGLQRVTEKIGSGESRKWNKILAGAALQVGDPLDNMFKLEGSISASPESEFNDQSIYPAHRQTTTLSASAEAVFSSFLLAYRYQNTTKKAPTSNDDEQAISAHRFGAGLKLGGFTFGIYRNATLETVGEKDLNSEEVTATISYNFI